MKRVVNLIIYYPFFMKHQFVNFSNIMLMNNFYPDFLTIYLILKMLVLYHEIIYFNF